MQTEFAIGLVELLIVSVVVAVLINLLFRNDNNYYSNYEITPVELVVVVISSWLVFWGMYSIVTMFKSSDTEFLNGRIAELGSTDGSRTICDSRDDKGNCTASHTEYYTQWWANTDYREYFSEGYIFYGETCQRCTPPASWQATKVGDPATTLHGYTNWIKGADKTGEMFPYSSLAEPLAAEGWFPERTYRYFDGLSAAPKAFYIGAVPYESSYAVSDKVYAMVEASNLLMEKNAVLGPTKQANLQLFIVRNQPLEYANAYMYHHSGGAKNDIDVFVGVTGDNEKIEWVAVRFGLVGLDYSDEANGGSNIRLEVELRHYLDRFDTIADAGGYAGLVNTSAEYVNLYFDRVPNKQFAELERDVKPRGGILTTIYIISGVYCLFACLISYLVDFNGLVSNNL